MPSTAWIVAEPLAQADRLDRRAAAIAGAHGAQPRERRRDELRRPPPRASIGSGDDALDRRPGHEVEEDGPDERLEREDRMHRPDRGPPPSGRRCTSPAARGSARTAGPCPRSPRPPAVTSWKIARISPRRSPATPDDGAPDQREHDVRRIVVVLGDDRPDGLERRVRLDQRLEQRALAGHDPVERPARDARRPGELLHRQLGEARA